MSDVYFMRGVLHRQNKTPPAYADNIEFYLNSVHVRKYIPSPEALLVRFKKFWAWVVINSAPTLSNPLPLVALEAVHMQQLINIGKGFVSGAPFTIFQLLCTPSGPFCDAPF